MQYIYVYLLHVNLKKYKKKIKNKARWESNKHCCNKLQTWPFKLFQLYVTQVGLANFHILFYCCFA